MFLMVAGTLPGNASPSTQRFREAWNVREGYRFGTSISSDGRLALIGEPGARDAFDTPVGGASLWEHTAQGWEQRAFHPSPAFFGFGPSFNGFGSAVALSQGTAVIAADGGWGGDGGVKIRDAWTSGCCGVTLLEGPGSAFRGVSVAIDADTIVVGLPGANGEAGEVRLFVRSSGTWSPGAVIAPPTLAAGDRFGAAVSLLGDSLLVGAPGNSGMVYPFVREGTAWSGRLPLGDETARSFGWSVAQSGSVAVVGAPGGSNAGVRVYDREADGTWLYRDELRSPRVNPGGFGTSVAIEPRGEIVVGAPGANAAYQFTRAVAAEASTPFYGLAAILLPDWEGDFGAAVAFPPAGILVGAPQEDPGASGTSGWVYAFDACAGSGPLSSSVHDDVAPALEGRGAEANGLRYANCSAVRRVERQMP